MRLLARLLLAAALAPTPGMAQEAPRGQAADSGGTGWRLVGMALDVHALPDSADGVLRTSGTVTVAAPAGGSLGPTLVLAPGGMQFDTVSAAGARVELSRTRDTAHIRLAVPADSGALVEVRFSSRARGTRVARSIAVGREGAFASWFGNWYPWPLPPQGSAASMSARGSLRLTIPEAWRALSNGRLTDSGSAAGVRRERWESDQPLAWSFIAAPYHVSRHRVGTTDVAIHLMPRQAGKGAAFARAVPPMVATLERAYGPYPFGTFGIAAIPAGIAPPGIGGRSEQGYFLTHEHALDDDSVNVPIFAHELAHMWWANSVLSDPPGDDMVDEAMAAHGAVLVLEDRGGRAAARRYLRDGHFQFSARSFFHLWRTGADQRLMDDFATLPSYSKGAWVYEMLRDRVGDSTFFATLKRIVRERAGKSTTLPDLRAAFLRAAPASADLERFFADWLDRPGAPVLTVTWSATTLDGRPAARVTITQRTRPYRLPLEIETRSAAGPLRTRVTLADSVQTFVLPARARPTGVGLDPSHRLMLWEPEFGPVPGVTPPRTLAENRLWLRDELAWLGRMYGNPGLAVAVVGPGGVEWTAGGGTVERGGRAVPVTPDTPLPLGDLATPARALDPGRFPATRTVARATELGRLLADLLAAAAGRAGPISADAARVVLAEGAPVRGDPLGATAAGGHGFRLATKKGARRVSAVSIADGVTGVMVGYPERGVGCVILVGDVRVGLGLATQILQRIAVVEGWPEVPGM